MAEARAVNPLVEQFQKGGVPRDLRLMAAQGVLPLGPADRVELVHMLLRDGEPDVRAAAESTLAAVTVDELLPIVRDRGTPVGVLAWVLKARSERELREVVLQNTSLADDAIREIAAELPEAEAELVVINQTRLLRSTPLLEALEANTSLSSDQRRRLRELRETFKIGDEPPAPPPPPPRPEPVLLPEPEPEEPTPLTEDEAMARYLSDDERQQTEKVSAVQKIYRLNTAEKVIAALKGSREERAILIRDPNRIVATAVLGSPRLTDAEVESFAAMKSLSDEILRKIGSHREWTKKYTVITALVKNPRTPLGLSMGMVSRLNQRDMKALSIDRNVSEVIRKQAQKFARGQVKEK